MRIAAPQMGVITPPAAKSAADAQMQRRPDEMTDAQAEKIADKEDPAVPSTDMMTAGFKQG